MKLTIGKLGIILALSGATFCGTCGTGSLTSSLHAQEKAATANSSVSQAEVDKLIAKAVDYLRTSQADDGSFSSKTGTGPTALVASALLAAKVPAEDPVVSKSIAYLLKHVQPDGGIYAPGSRHQNYDSCLAVVALSRANASGKYTEQIKKLEAFLKQQQWDEGEGKQPSDTFYGGAGYGSKARPDLSNTGFLIEALHELGRDGNDEAIQRALVFVSRCQNLESPANNLPVAAKVNDGGFYYTAANGGESMAGAEADGGLRSYGSMTYAGLKSMIYAGVSKDDPRVKAAVTFLQKNYTVDSNPGMGQSGLYYYLQTMSKALNAQAMQHSATATANPMTGGLRSSINSSRRKKPTAVGSMQKRVGWKAIQTSSPAMHCLRSPIARSESRPISPKSALA